ncbi:MAG: filamentous hemagglutinin N-terminal domain-containing protein, partial [Saccharospirillaceae bacterium]|nr:filamentous hemagglutinin N-terminal domain-containing protein [Pseudomonadales bacterium]NRB77929.1 filamentous hemagglutinin N-terminal domain-containing protein [Saccharospirillaceae bacterium]
HILQQRDYSWIDWDSFSIDENETVNFQLLNEQGISVNRVVGNDLSEIMGQLNSNANVFLINPNGVLFGENSQVNVGGLFISDHNLNNEGQLSSSNNTQGITLLGEINSKQDLLVLANRIKNEGLIQAENIDFLVNQGALLQLDDTGLVSVLIPSTTQNENSTNNWIKNSGVLIANGNIYIGSANINDWLNQLNNNTNLNIELTGQIEASKIDVFGEDIFLDDAELTAQLINIESSHQIIIADSILNTEQSAQNSAEIRIRGEEIQIIDDSIIQTNSGKITIGGEFQGGKLINNEPNNNAQFVYVSSSVKINADGNKQFNDGGEVIIWSDDTTVFSGDISAQAYVDKGNGGFVEVSGKQTLVFRGDVDTSAQNGQTGQLLLDPDVITIANGAGVSADTDGVVAYTDYAGTDITIYEQDLEAISAGTNISLQADESIFINDLSDGALTLNQTGSVIFTVSNDSGEARFEMLDTNDTIEMTGGGNLGIALFGNVSISTPAEQTATMILGNIDFSAGGSVDLRTNVHGAGITSDEMTLSVRDINITGDGTVIILADNTEDTDVGLVTIDVGNITVTGTGGANNVSITASNDNLAALVSGAATVNLNGDLNIAGTAHTVTIQGLEDTVAGGSSNSYGDINVLGGQITLSAGTWNLLDPDNHVQVNSMTNFSGGGSGVDLTAFTTDSIIGNANSLTIANSGAHNLAWDEFTDINFLFYRTDADLTLSDVGTGTNKDINNTQLALIDGSVQRLTLQATNNITSTNAVIATQLALRADRDGDGSGTVILNGLNTTNQDLTISGADISGDGSATDVGSGLLTIDTNGNGQAISVNGSDTFNIENAVWNAFNSTLGVTIDDSSHITFAAGSLNNNVILDGSSGTGVTISGAAKTWAGANTLQLIGDSFIQTDITMSNVASVLDVDGTLSLGVSNASAGESITLTGDFDFSGTTSIDLLMDTGDNVFIDHNGSAALDLPNIISSNGDPLLDVDSDRSATMAGFEGGVLIVTIDSNNNGNNYFNTTGTYDIDGFSLSGTGTTDTSTIDGNWTIDGSASLFNLDTVTFLNDAFIANGSMSLPTTSTLILGTSSTAFDLGSTTSNVIFIDVLGNRPLNITAAGSISGGSINVASRALSMISDSDLSGDESITTTFIQAGDLTLAGDFDWNFNPVLSGDYIQTRGDVLFDDAIVSAFTIDLTSAGIVSFSGSSNTLEARSGDINVVNLIDDGSNANLIIQATGAITANTIVTALGDLTLESDTDAAGSEMTSLNDSSGGFLNLINNTTLDGTFNYTDIISTGNVILNDVNITVDNLDNSTWSSTTLTGINNVITASAGNIIFDDVSGTSADLTLNATGLITVNNLTTGTGDLLLQSAASVVINSISTANFYVQIDSDDNGLESFLSSGTNIVTDLNIVGTSANDNVNFDGLWTINGDVSTTTLDTFNIINDELTANSFDFTGANLLDFATGNQHDMSATSGDIKLSNLTSDRPLRFTASNTIFLSAITSTDMRVKLTADDVTGDGSAINLGLGELYFQTNTGETKLTVGDAGVDTFTIEANIWDNLTVGQISLDTIGAGDTITFLEDTLPANLFIDGSAGVLTFSGAAKNFIGSTITTDTDVVFLQDFTSDSVIDIDGSVIIGAANTTAGDNINIIAPLWFSGVTDIQLLGDTGDSVNLTSIGTTGMQVANVSSINGAVDLVLSSQVGMDLNGFEGGTLTVEIDSNNDSTNTLTTIGNYTLSDFTLNANGFDDDALIDGNWVLSSAVNINNISNLTFLNDSFVANNNLTIAANTLILGTDPTTFNLGSTTGNVTFANLNSDRALNITAAGSIVFDQLNVNTHNLNLTSNSDLSGDENITANLISAADLNINGDILWDFDVILTGVYSQNSGDVIINDASLTASNIDFSNADSVLLSGSNNTLIVLAGDLTLDNLLDDGSAANLNLNATGVIIINNIDTAMGDLVIDSDTDNSGNEGISITQSNAGDLILNDQTNLLGNNVFASLTNSASTILSNSELTLNSLNNNDIVFNGTQNNLNIINGNLQISNISIADNSQLNISLGAGEHVVSTINNNQADIEFTAIDMTINQNLSLNGDWNVNNLVVNDLNDLNILGNINVENNAELQVLNDITINDNSLITVSTININAGRDAKITGLVSLSETLNAVNITAGRNILDGGDSQYDINVLLKENYQANAVGVIDNLEIIYQLENNNNIKELIDEITSITDDEIIIVKDDTQSTDPTQSNEGSVGVLPNYRLGLTFPECTNKNKDCEKHNAISSFLGSLLIGGRLPD